MTPSPNPDNWPLAALDQALTPLVGPLKLEVASVIDSSNSELLRRARAGCHTPTLLIAERQSAGHGRLQRPWYGSASEPGGTSPGSLLFSLGLTLAPKNWSGLSLAVGCSIACSLEPQLQLKWPNDLCWQGRKLGGILIETTSLPAASQRPGRYAVIGIGLNIVRPLVPAVFDQAAGLNELLPAIDAMQALQQIAPALVAQLLQFEQHGFAPFQALFNQRDILHHAEVELSDGRTGLALGVDASGALQLQTKQGLQSITSAEVSLRPRA